MYKSDLKDGMMVENSQGDIYQVKGKSLIGLSSYYRLEEMSEDLKDKDLESLDIIKVVDAREFVGTMWDMFQCFSEHPVLWEREEFNFKAGDKVQVRDHKGDKWKKAYFVKEVEDESRWRVTFYDEFITGESFEEMSKAPVGEDYAIGYRYIRPYREEE